jgi:hypothetical protein
MEDINETLETSLEPIVHAKKANQSPLKKAVKVFFEEDMSTVGSSVIEDYLKPRSKTMALDMKRKLREYIADTLKGCVDILVWGKKNNNSRVSTTSYNGTTVNYVRFSDEPVMPVPNIITSRLVTYEIEGYENAQKVLGKLMSKVQEHGFVPLAYYYDMIGVKPETIDHEIGWKSLDDIQIIHTKGKNYIINLPEPHPKNEV